jgi:hypothetical protein
MNATNNLPENNQNLNIKSVLLDPLSVIIKLAILGNKPIGTKILIQNNVIYLQEPGPFQSICRLFYKSNKTDLQFMYNPIQIACSSFLTKEGIEKHPRIKILFSCAQNGLRKLMETYKNCSIISLCLNYYYAIITNHIDQIKNDKIFYKDNLSNFYSSELTNSLNEQWTEDKKKVILDLITFLTGDNMANNNVKSLETIMENNDLNTQHIILHF